MLIRNILTGKTFRAEWRRDHPASSYGQAVLVLTNTGEAVDAAFFEIVKEGKSDEKRKEPCLCSGK